MKEPQDHQQTAPKTFEFTYGGKKFSIPSFSALPMGAIRKARKAENEMDSAFLILESVMPEGSPELAAIDAMSGSEFNDFLTGWTQGAPVGESVGFEN